VHAWTGSILLIVFAAQYVVGIFAFALCKTRILPLTLAGIARWHVLLGKLCFLGCIGVCVNGWADIQMMNVDYGQFPYKAATMLGSASAIAYWGLSASM
ncbi:unnamed protein product, partial [Phaeothamnion confervicola]